MDWDEVFTILLAKFLTDREAFKKVFIFIISCIFLIIFIVFLVLALDKDTTPPSSILNDMTVQEVATDVTVE